MATDRVIGVDLGGTKILAGVIDREGNVHETIERPTITISQSALLAELEAAVRSLPLAEVGAVGFGVPSRIDLHSGLALGAVNIPLGDVDVRAEMARRLDRPVGVENDASCAAYAEFRHGAGRGVANFVMLTLGTGVGGGVIALGSLFRTWTELGHMVIVEDGEPCYGACSGRGHVEAYCSGRAADRIAERVLGPGSSARDLIEQRRPELQPIGHHLGVAMGSLVNIFGAERIVIGGGFGVAAFDQLLPAARMAVLTEALAPGGQNLEIERAALGATAGLIGAGLIAFEALAAQAP